MVQSNTDGDKKDKCPDGASPLPDIETCTAYGVAASEGAVNDLTNPYRNYGPGCIRGSMPAGGPPNYYQPNGGLHWNPPTGSFPQCEVSTNCNGEAVCSKPGLTLF